jgi:signal transduction histidine kinase
VFAGEWLLGGVVLAALAVVALIVAVLVLLGRRRSARRSDPSPGLWQREELFEYARSAGLQVREHGRPGDLPRPVDITAYRILQESLTNVIEHANQPHVVDVRFGRRDRVFELVVRDDGKGASAARVGDGLRGMQAQAAALGGRVEISTTSAGGFQVRAVLPVPAWS